MMRALVMNDAAPSALVHCGHAVRAQLTQHAGMTAVAVGNFGTLCRRRRLAAAFTCAERVGLGEARRFLL